MDFDGSLLLEILSLKLSNNVEYCMCFILPATLQGEVRPISMTINSNATITAYFRK